MWIANFSMEQIKNGEHFDVSWQPTILIQIKDPDLETFVVSPQQDLFKEVHRFSFWDCETEDIGLTDMDGNKIAEILKNAQKNNYNVMVHCHAGICRSGAVVEAGLLIGFKLPEDAFINYRVPNRLVLKKIRKHLGFSFSWE